LINGIIISRRQSLTYGKEMPDIGPLIKLPGHHNRFPDEIPYSVHAHLVTRASKIGKISHMEMLLEHQIAWYLIAPFKISLNIDIDIQRYLPFVAIAVVADMVPLLNINRAMVKFGIKPWIDIPIPLYPL